MQLRPPILVEACAGWEEAISAVPDVAAVFLIWPREGPPYLARTSVLRRRLARLLSLRDRPSRLLNLREVAARVEYWVVASRLESSLTFHALARRHFPENYRKVQNLRLPPYLRVLLANEFPRTTITTHLAASRSFSYGPFRNRAAAEQFEGEVLDLFQVRRCPEDLAPSPDHPGCMYGEMNLCLRPCQQVVTGEEYRSEVDRLVHFLESQGESLLDPAAKARERLSAEMEFEEAARQHKRCERIQQVLKLRDDLTAAVERLHGVAVTPSVTAEAVGLWFVVAGGWVDPIEFPVNAAGGEIVSMDRRLREASSPLVPPRLTVREREDQLALLARWYYSSGRDGEWLAFEDLKSIPFRKLVNAIHRVAAPRR